MRWYWQEGECRGACHSLPNPIKYAASHMQVCTMCHEIQGCVHAEMHKRPDLVHPTLESGYFGRVEIHQCRVSPLVLSHPVSQALGN